MKTDIIALICHGAACLLFPITTSIGFQIYTVLFGKPFSRGTAIGLAVPLIFVAFILINGLIAMASSMKIKITLTCALFGSVLIYLFPEHPLRAFFCKPGEQTLIFSHLRIKTTFAYRKNK